MHDWIQHHLDRQKANKSEGTYDRRKGDCKRFQAWLDDNGLDLESVDHTHLEAFLLHLDEEGYAPKTIDAHFESLRALYKDFTEWFDYVPESENPFERLDRTDYVNGGAKKRDESEVIYVTLDEKEQLCDTVSSPGFRNELVIRLLWQTGVRKTELRNILLTDIADYDSESGTLTPETRKITIRTLKQQDEDETRPVYWSESLDWMMKAWVENERHNFLTASDSEYLFVTERSERMGEHGANAVVRQAAENAGIQEVAYRDKNGNPHRRITTHALRHGHAVHALKCGVDLRTIQKHLGHSDLEQTEKYLELLDSDVRDAYSRRFRPNAEPEL